MPDLSAGGRTRVADEAGALDLLRGAAAWPPGAAELAADSTAEAAPPPGDGESDGSGLAAVRALVTPGPHVDLVLAALECGVLGVWGAMERKVRLV